MEQALRIAQHKALCCLVKVVCAVFYARQQPHVVKVAQGHVRAVIRHSILVARLLYLSYRRQYHLLYKRCEVSVRSLSLGVPLRRVIHSLSHRLVHEVCVVVESAILQLQEIRHRAGTFSYEVINIQPTCSHLVQHFRGGIFVSRTYAIAQFTQFLPVFVKEILILECLLQLVPVYLV